MKRLKVRCGSCKHIVEIFSSYEYQHSVCKYGKATFDICTKKIDDFYVKKVEVAK